MSHLTDETIARLVDEAPTALEAAHLSVCEHCRDELQAMHAQVAELSGLPELQPPAGDWERLEQKLAAEGLIRRRAVPRPWIVYGLRAAAAIALVATGALTGRLVPAPAAPGAPLADASPAESGKQNPASSRPERSGAAPAILPEQTAPTGTRLASQLTPSVPRTAEAALQQLRLAESNYLDALTRFAELSGTTTAGDPAARLAALEGIVLTTRAALGKAPTDAVINGYFLNAVAQRDATIRQIGATNTAESWF
ncbi:MAG: hypothetical protein FIB01_02985 [Gemmatimonadetes bacterium]|nr:hypothetical protein [Gemmatimonadota bacterium]